MTIDACSAGAAPECRGVDLTAGSDLSLLVHRAALGMRCTLDRACREQGLTDGRDWLVLDALDEGLRRTQLELSRMLGIDKTTLTAVLDRLERAGLVVRRADPNDRRARIPVPTPSGRTARARVSCARDAIERSLLADVPTEIQTRLRELLLALSTGARTATDAMVEGVG